MNPYEVTSAENGKFRQIAVPAKPLAVFCRILLQNETKSAISGNKRQFTGICRIVLDYSMPNIAIYRPSVTATPPCRPPTHPPTLLPPCPLPPCPLPPLGLLAHPPTQHHLHQIKSLEPATALALSTRHIGRNQVGIRDRVERLSCERSLVCERVERVGRKERLATMWTREVLNGLRRE
jgi:hypothetical protein